MTAPLRFFRLSQCGFAVIALVLSMAADGTAQSHEWLVGMWSGTYTQRVGATPVSGTATLTVREEAGTLKWTRTGESSREGKAVAEGVVTKVDASSAEFEGKYISHWLPRYIGTGTTMSLTRSPSGLSGGSMSELGRFPTTLELTKGK